MFQTQTKYSKDITSVFIIPTEVRQACCLPNFAWIGWKLMKWWQFEKQSSVTFVRYAGAQEFVIKFRSGVGLTPGTPLRSWNNSPVSPGTPHEPATRKSPSPCHRKSPSPCCPLSTCRFFYGTNWRWSRIRVLIFGIKEDWYTTYIEKNALLYNLRMIFMSLLLFFRKLSSLCFYYFILYVTLKHIKKIYMCNN